MRASRLLLLGAAAYGAFLVATLPASVIAPRLDRLTRGEATLANPSGSAWNGAASLAIRAPRLAVTLDEVRWRFLPSRLLAGRIAFAVEARLGGLRARGEASRTPMAWRLDGARAEGDAASLAAVFPLAAAWQPAGELAIEAPGIAWDGSRATGSATAEWRDAALSLSPLRPLGSWRAQATAEGATVRVSLATLEGPLRLSGEGRLGIPGRLEFSGEARAEPGRERDLEALLALLGPRRADGAHALALH